MNFSGELERLKKQLADLETSARKLANQNFADIVQSAAAKVGQLLEHPDLEAAGEQLAKDLDTPERLPFGDGQPSA